MAQGVTIRPYADADAAACRVLWAELTERHRALYDNPAIGGTDPGSGFDRYLAEDRPTHVWVADDDGEIVGLAGLLVAGGRAELEPIVVAESRRGRGIGRLLGEAVVSVARAEGFRRVRVRPVGRNADAIAFFHALGFDVLARVELQLDLDKRSREPGERIACRDFSV